eukprot:SAG31_NODE_12723_length_921_cov_1.310219_2_plen_46_part_01
MLIRILIDLNQRVQTDDKTTDPDYVSIGLQLVLQHVTVRVGIDRDD